MIRPEPLSGDRRAVSGMRPRATHDRETHDDKTTTGVLLATLLCGVGLAGFVLATPEWNFDAVCCAGAARVWLGESPAQAHASVYKDLQATAPADAVEAIRSLSEYRDGWPRVWRRFWCSFPCMPSRRSMCVGSRRLTDAPPKPVRDE